MSRNLIIRILVAAVSIPAILWVSYEGNWWLFGMVALFALAAMIEYVYNEGHRPWGLSFWAALILVAVVFWDIGAGLAQGGDKIDWALLSFQTTGPIWLLGFFLLSAMTFAIGKEAPDVLFTKTTRLVWGVIYIGGLYPHVLFLGRLNSASYAFSGGDCLLFLFGMLWVGDTAAMGVGSFLGKHRLAPAVSPNKTIEGFVGGLIGALLMGAAMMFWKFSAVPWYHLLIITVGVSIFGQLGDLVESMWKRSCNVKDSSHMIPGHGGILDRFDSLLFAAPFMYYYMSYFLRG